MLKLQHPASLNAFQQYRQACRIMKRTSRASISAWYQEALDLELQLHIRYDGESCTTHFLKKSTHEWSPGPTLAPGIFKDHDQAAQLAKELMSAARALKTQSIGVVVHIANEFATTELKPELDNPAALPDLRDASVHDPGSILDDSSVPADQTSCRLIPYPAEGSETIATAATVSQYFGSFLDTLRSYGESNNFPIITHALSAPLVALTAMGSLVNPGPGKPFVAILQYSWFTVVGFFNAQAELKLIRSMQHRGRKRSTRFRHALNTTNSSLEFIDPDFFIVPLGEDVDTMLEADMRFSMPESRIEVLQPPPDLGALQRWNLEPWLCANAEPLPSHIHSNTFTMLRDEKWAFQNFLPVKRDVAEHYPTHGEMKLLRLARIIRVSLFLLVLAGLSLLAIGLGNVIRQPEWAFNATEADLIKARLVLLNQERARAEHWHNLLDDRSKAWVIMEDLAMLIPENANVKVQTFQYTVTPETTRGMSSVGFVRKWMINGLVRQDGGLHLSGLTAHDGIAEHFASVAQVTGNAAYLPADGTRSINVGLRSQHNRQYRETFSPEDYASNRDLTYPNSFALEIDQRFESQDPIAVKATAAP